MRGTMAAVGIAAALTVVQPALAASGPAIAQASEPPNAQPEPAAEAKPYLHPIRKFILPVPPGSDLAEQGEGAQVTIRSRQGYIIKVQTGDANRALDLPQMAAKLESKYLGPRRPWTQKLSDGTATVAGLEALDAVYEGGGTRIKVVIARGVKTDFVFMFFAPVDSFQNLLAQFEWVLAGFQPNPADHPATAGPTPPTPAVAASARTAPKRFAEGGFGYTIQYPGDWEMATPSPDTATFSGLPGTDAFQAVVSIQNVRPPSAETPDQAAAAALAGLKTSLRQQAADLSVIGERPLTYKNGRLSLAGRKLVVTYSFAGERYRKWAVVLPRPAGTVAHIWSYTAPETRFETYRPLADAMLKSWTIRPEDG